MVYPTKRLVGCKRVYSWAFGLSFLRGSQDKVADALGIDKTKSTWRNLVASLVKIGVAEYPSRTSIRLTEKMFPVVARPGENE
jgi:DNA-binding IclR family transcriptional regulator